MFEDLGGFLVIFLFVLGLIILALKFNNRSRSKEVASDENEEETDESPVQSVTDEGYPENEEEEK